MTLKYRGVILDVDGVLKRGDKPIPGASEVIDKLRKAGVKVVILSNLSSKSREDYVETLKSLGIKVAPEDLVLATSATAMYVARNCKRGTVYYVGHEGLRKELEKAGLKIVEKRQEIVNKVYKVNTIYRVNPKPPNRDLKKVGRELLS